MCTWLSSFLPLLSAVVSLAYFPGSYTGIDRISRWPRKKNHWGLLVQDSFTGMMLYVADQIDFSPEMSMITRSIFKKWQRWSISLLLILASLRVDGDCRAERMAALKLYLKARPSAEVEPASIGTVIVDDSVVKLIEEEVTRTNVSLADDFASLFCHYW